MSSCILHDLDSTLSVIGNDITSDIRLTVHSIDYDSIISTLLNSISPNKRHWSGFIIVSDALNSIFMRFGNLIVVNLRFVILNFDTNSTNLDFILNDVCIDVESSCNGWAPAESNLVSLDVWSCCHTLNKNSSSLTTHYNIFRNETTVLRFQINHYGSRIEMSKRALMDHGITLDWKDTCSSGFVKCVTLKVAMEDLDTCVWVGDNAWDLLVSFFCAAIKRQNTVIHFENTTLDVDKAEHVFFNIEFLDYLSATISIKLHIFLEGFHVKLFVRTSQNHL